MTVEQWLGENNKLGIDIWERKYQQFIPSKNRKETFDEWLDRVTGSNEEYKRLIVEKKFLYGGRILANRGMNKEGRRITYSNCYVLSTDDSIEDIYETASGLARTYSYGGGVGIDLSKLRPEGAKVNNAANTTTGPLSFAEIFEKTTEVIGQQGRRGALMLSMSCEHPDIEKFIKVKTDLDRITHANMSVRFTDEFLEDAEDGRIHHQEFKVNTSAGDYIITNDVDASSIIDMIAECNWDMGEPGMLFWDRIENWNLLSNNKNFEFAGVNPCAEEPLPEGGSCLLGSMNLDAYVTNEIFDELAYFNDVKIAVKALNEVLFEGLPLHPLQVQKNTVHNWRQIGLGNMGLGDALINMEIRYGSPEAVKFSERIGKLMINAAVVESAKLVKEYGAYPAMGDVEDVVSTPFAKEVLEEDTIAIIRRYGGLCNSQLLTTAPTGTLSTMLGITGGIEPVFANYYERTTKSLHGEDVVYKVYTPVVLRYMEECGFDDDALLPEFFITARELNPYERISMQAAWQKYIDASISSTINLAEDVTPEEIRKIYMAAWKAGLKGVTVFRENCRRIAILNTTTKKEEDASVDTKEEITQKGTPEKINDQVIGKKRKLITGCGSLHCIAFFDPNTGQLKETFFSKGSDGGCNNFMTGLSRMISLSARSEVSLTDIVDQLFSCGVCPSYATRRAVKKDTSKGSCCPVAIGNALLDMSKEVQMELKAKNTSTYHPMLDQIRNTEENTDVCPECGERLVHEGGCDICKSCGWSKCV